MEKSGEERMQRSITAVLAVVLAACGDPAPPWSIEVTGSTVPRTASVGEELTISLTLANSGSARSPGTTLQFDGIDNLDLIGCDPACERTNLGTLLVFLPGITGGVTATYEVSFLATAIGVAEVSVCAYDDRSAKGTQVWCGDATLVVR